MRDPWREPPSVNTHVQALKGCARRPHEEGHRTERVRPPLQHGGDIQASSITRVSSLRPMRERNRAGGDARLRRNNRLSVKGPQGGSAQEGRPAGSKSANNFAVRGEVAERESPPLTTGFVQTELTVENPEVSRRFRSDSRHLHGPA